MDQFGFEGKCRPFSFWHNEGGVWLPQQFLATSWETVDDRLNFDTYELESNSSQCEAQNGVQ